jgi:hypothetical protein
MALTDDDKRRIEEEERFRAAARLRAEADAKKKEAETKGKKGAFGCLGCFGVLFVMWLLGTMMGTQKGDSAPSSQFAAPSASAAPAASAQTTPTESDTACRQDLMCWAEKHFVSASVRCKDVVENLAKYQSEWTDGLLEPKFSRYRWMNKDKGVVTYVGDRIKFQNGFGAWQMMVYECDFDTNSNRPVDARARPGRIN